MRLFVHIARFLCWVVLVFLMVQPVVAHDSADRTDAFPQQAGFPIEVEGSIESSVVFADVDNDGKKEIAFNSKYAWKTYIFKYDGTPLNGAWPVSHGVASPGLADFDSDKISECLEWGGWV